MKAPDEARQGASSDNASGRATRSTRRGGGEREREKQAAEGLAVWCICNRARAKKKGGEREAGSRAHTHTQLSPLSPPPDAYACAYARQSAQWKRLARCRLALAPRALAHGRPPPPRSNQPCGLARAAEREPSLGRRRRKDEKVFVSACRTRRRPPRLTPNQKRCCSEATIFQRGVSDQFPAKNKAVWAAKNSTSPGIPRRSLIPVLIRPIQA